MTKTIKQYFIAAQSSAREHDKFCTEILSGDQVTKKSVLAKVDEVIHCLKYVMVEYKPEPAVERLVSFAARLVAKANNEEQYNVLFERVMNFLLQSYDVNDKAVRYRSCQLIAQILTNLGDAELDDELYGELMQAMHTRLSDISSSVRVHATTALTRMQDPSDKHCPIIKSFIFLMSSDPNWQVRLGCLKNVAATRRSLLAMIERTRDVNEVVRRMAYQVIAEKVSVKALSISQRLALLENGHADSSVHVQKACMDKLLQAWLVHYQANILDLLGGLDIMSSGDVCEKAVRTLLSKAPASEILEEFDLLDEDRLLQSDRLTCESVFYYRVVLAYISELKESSDELLEKLVPEAKPYISYITSVFERLENAEISEIEKASIDYILEQLIICMKYIDVSDPISRTNVLELCRKLLSSDQISLSLVPQLITCLEMILKSWQARMGEVANIIADIQVPNIVEEQPVDPDTLHQLKLKVASVTMKLNELSELMTEAVQKQAFVAAAELKEKMELLEVSKKELIEQMAPKPVKVASQARNDDVTTLKCLTIFVELMRASDISTMTDTMRSYLDQLVVPAIPERCPAVRNQAIQALGLCSLCDQEVSRKYLPIFLQICQLDEEAVRLSALQSLFDIILVHGMECFQQEPNKVEKTCEDGEENDEGEKKRRSKSDSEEPVDEVFESLENNEEDGMNLDTTRSANTLIQIFVDCLEDESSVVRTLCAKGLAKLLVTGKVVSSKLLSRLILLWYNPVTEEDVTLKHCLGVFFPVFAFADRSNQIQIEKAFLPTLNIIFDAPNSSPLSDIDDQNVMELLVQLTNPRDVKEQTSADAPDASTSHEALAMTICNEIMERGNGYGVVTLCKALNFLELNSENGVLIKDLNSLSTRLLQVVKERRCRLALEKFGTRVRQMASTQDEDTEESSVQCPESEKELSDEIDRTALDTTVLNASRLKRVAANKSKSLNKTLLNFSDTSDSDETSGHKTSRRKTKAPKLDEGSD
ncbi:condensin complex subunit 3-like isoform X2 [Watersipora subatra]|uniref:condensin complex subunit 3-like isoform X2 n=1 Tax=Watersipora subatra TaxID=2589382 RepID=UPI00355BEDEA